MHSYFDLLVLAALFAPIALIVAGNLAAYRSGDAGEGLLAVPPEAAIHPLAPRASEPAGSAPELPELRHAA